MEEELSLSDARGGLRLSALLVNSHCALAQHENSSDIRGGKLSKPGTDRVISRSPNFSESATCRRVLIIRVATRQR